MSTLQDARPPVGLDILDKADAVLRVLEREGDASVNTLATAVGEPVSSTYRLLASLTSLGWVERAPRRGMYRLGVYLLTVGSVCEQDLDTREAIHPSLMELHERTGMACLFWVRRGARAVCIDRIEGRMLRLSGVRLGDSLPLSVSGGPRSLLAHLPRGEREAVLASLATGPDGLDLDELRAGLDVDRARGWAVNEAVPPAQGILVGEVAAPVVNHRGELAGVVAARGLQEGLLARQDDVVRCVREAAAAASAALGAREEAPRG